MSSKLFQYSLTTNPKDIFGSKLFIINISIKNLSSNTVFMEPMNFEQHFGKLIDSNTTTDNTAFNTLEKQKDSLIGDIERIVKKIFLAQIIKEEEQEIKNMGKSISKISRFFSLLRFDNLIENSYYNFYKYFKKLPEDIDKATQINSLSDLDFIERAIGETDFNKESTLFRSFKINKNKLNVCVEEINKYEKLDIKKQVGLRYIKIPSKSEMLFSYTLKLPFLFKETNYSYILTSKVVDTSDNFIENFKVEKEFEILPSSSSIPLGAVIGGILGYLFKITFLNYENNKPIIMEILGCILVTFIFSLLVRRMPKKKKMVPFTVDDLWGGLVFGFLIGLFTDHFIDYLEKLVPSGN